ncbi:MAG: hypothetical protein IPH06_09625 [Alphaproteobacteria bacterium]|nr:hypothetical protein [Alphaproteobacteria bacterium]QQS58254.1 MAG: hypothetical protein IPN28_05380 [Alphaproteobacteria bacterium]
MDYRTSQRLKGLLKAVGLTGLFAIGMHEPEEARPDPQARIENYQRSHGCTEDQIARYKEDGIPPHCPEK